MIHQSQYAEVLKRARKRLQRAQEAERDIRREAGGELDKATRSDVVQQSNGGHLALLYPPERAIASATEQATDPIASVTVVDHKGFVGTPADQASASLGSHPRLVFVERDTVLSHQRPALHLALLFRRVVSPGLPGMCHGTGLAGVRGALGAVTVRVHG